MDESEITAEELRELIREGHRMVRDLTHERKETLRVMAELRAVVEEVRSAPTDTAQAAMQTILDTMLKQVADETAEVAESSCKFVEDAIFQRFDILMNTILGIDKAREEVSIPELLRKQAAALDVDTSGLEGILKPIERPVISAHAEEVKEEKS